jgi:acylphosphatase
VKKATEGNVRFEVVFKGAVQGVNFRWTTCRVAERFDVAGWVRNERDGSVRLVAEGEQEELERFVEAVQEAMAGYVRETSIDQGAATGDLEGFSITR